MVVVTYVNGLLFTGLPWGLKRPRCFSVDHPAGPTPGHNWAPERSAWTAERPSKCAPHSPFRSPGRVSLSPNGLPPFGVTN